MDVVADGVCSKLVSGGPGKRPARYSGTAAVVFKGIRGQASFTLANSVASAMPFSINELRHSQAAYEQSRFSFIVDQRPENNSSDLFR